MRASCESAINPEEIATAVTNAIFQTGRGIVFRKICASTTSSNPQSTEGTRIAHSDTPNAFIEAAIMYNCAMPRA